MIIEKFALRLRIILYGSLHLKINTSLSKNSAAEFNQLKELRRRGASTAELKVGGIPDGNTVAFSNLANKLLEMLKLQELCKDILEVREIKAKMIGTGAAPNGNVDARGENGHNKISFIIQFKSQFVSQHFLKIKRQHGMIKFKDLVPDGTDNVITVFEILPPFLNELRILAKDRAVQRGYKHVWPVNGCIYVKQTDSSVPIVISTEQDLNNIVSRLDQPRSHYTQVK